MDVQVLVLYRTQPHGAHGASFLVDVAVAVVGSIGVAERCEIHGCGRQREREREREEPRDEQV